MSQKKLPMGQRIFRALLRLLPFDFRWDYGEEMEEVFQEQHKEVQQKGGTMSLLQLWGKTIAGIFVTAPREHLAMLRQDTEYALRMMRKNPGFTTIAVLTLALGIGANTAIFSIVNGVLLRPLPYGEGERIVVLTQQAPLAKITNLRFSVKDIEDYREQTQTLEQVVEFHSMEFTLLINGAAERVKTGVVSDNFFDVLGVKPLLGRTFLPGEDDLGAEPVFIMTYEYWQKKHGGDPEVLGKAFEMNGLMHTVVGVLPPVPQYPVEREIYMPTSHCPTRSSQGFIDNRSRRMMQVFGRAKEGVTPSEIQSDLALIAGRLGEDYPGDYPVTGGYSVRSAALKEELTREAQPTLIALLVATGFVLLIACANVANLTLSRVLRRERELALRAALGASRSRILRQLLTESTLLAVFGGVLGLGVAFATLDSLVAFTARFTPRAFEVTLDSSVLLFTVGLSLATGILFGVIPAFSSRKELVAALNETAGRSTAGVNRHRARAVLVVSQVAVSFLLLIGAGLMLRSFVALHQVDAGFRPENVLTMRVGLNWQRFGENTQERMDNRKQFFRDLLERVESTPGVASAAVTNIFPLLRSQANRPPLEIEGKPLLPGEVRPVIDVTTASLGYFQTVGIPLVKGRLFEETDAEGAPLVTIITQSMARRYWEGEDPIGKRISIDQGRSWMRIVGVVGDVRQLGLDQGVTDSIFTRVEQWGFPRWLLVRTQAGPLSMPQTLRKIVLDLAPDQTVDSVLTLEQIRSDSIARPRLTTQLIGLFAGLALFITVAGISGVIALSVSQRTHEFGIRMALGATPGALFRSVLRQGLTPVVIGLVLGILGAFSLTRLMSSFLFGVEPTDPVTFILVSLTLMAAAAVACLVPARRATRVDPMVALRYE